MSKRSIAAELNPQHELPSGADALQAFAGQLKRTVHTNTLKSVKGNQMNRTDGEPETDVMATAFSTMRKYGMNIITATQHMDINAYVKSDPRMPRTRLRRYRDSTACAVRP